MLEAFDRAVVRARRDPEVVADPVHRLVMERIDATFLTVDIAKNGAIVKGDVVPFGGGRLVESSVAGDVLVEGATGVDVDYLQAPTDACHGHLVGINDV